MGQLLTAIFNILLDKLPLLFFSFFAPYLPKRVLREMAIYYPDARIRRRCFQLTSVKIGDDTYPNIGIIVIDDYQNQEELLEIGNRVALAPGIVFAADSAPNASRLRDIPYVRNNLIKRAKIIVEDDVWIGANAVILPGIRIGRGVIVGAGAVVTADVPPYTVVAGIPARIIRNLNEKNTEVVECEYYTPL